MPARAVIGMGCALLVSQWPSRNCCPASQCRPRSIVCLYLARICCVSSSVCESGPSSPQAGCERTSNRAVPRGIKNRIECTSLALIDRQVGLVELHDDQLERRRINRPDRTRVPRSVVVLLARQVVEHNLPVTAPLHEDLLP